MFRPLLRRVLLDGTDYQLTTWDTRRVDSLDKVLIAYEFGPSSNPALFSGADFACSPLIAVDSDDALRSLLGFLTLRPGDTDREYFAGYTDAQMAFAQGPDAEELQMWTLDEDPIGTFVDVDEEG